MRYASFGGNWVLPLFTRAPHPQNPHASEAMQWQQALGALPLAIVISRQASASARRMPRCRATPGRNTKTPHPCTNRWRLAAGNLRHLAEATCNHSAGMASTAAFGKRMTDRALDAK